MSLNDYDRPTLEFKLEQAKKRQADLADRFHPEDGKHFEKDMAIYDSAYEHIGALKDIAGKIPHRVMLGTTPPLRGEITAMEQQIGEVIHDAETRKREWESLKTSVENIPLEITTIESAIKNRDRLESKLWGWFGLIGKPFGSTGKWSKEEFEFATLQLNYTTGKISSPSAKDDAYKVICEHWEGAKDDIKRWAEENECGRVAVIPANLQGKDGQTFKGVTLYRVVTTNDGRHGDFSIADGAAKYLRVWHRPEVVKKYIEEIGVQTESSFIHEGYWIVDDDGVHAKSVIQPAWFAS